MLQASEPCRDAALFIAGSHGYGPPHEKQHRWTHDMADHVIPHFHNDSGVARIEIGVHEFMCVGARPPFDHPHIYIDLGDEDEKVCAYCSTLYRYSKSLSPTETVPPGHLFVDSVPA